MDGLHLERYHRQIILPHFGPEAQQRLSGARVLVIGMGGLGSPAALYLAAAGVGTIGLADFDRVELSNLHRQILHDTEAVQSGLSKIESAHRRLQGLNPEIKLETHPAGVHPGNARELFSQYDVVVDGTDNLPSRFLHADAAFLCNRPLVYGSVFQYEGQLSVFQPGPGNPCYRCLFPTQPDRGDVPSCAEAGVMGAICGVVGSWQALEALKLIADLGEPAVGTLTIFNALQASVRRISIERDPHCPLCGTHASITDIDPHRYGFAEDACADNNQASRTRMNTMKAKTKPIEQWNGVVTVEDAAAALENPGNAVLLDVREPYEVAHCRLPGALHIPMEQMPERWSELPEDRPIIVYCHHGFRSMNVVRFLKAQGVQNAHNLKGGIDAWSKRIDPSIPRY